MTKGHGERAFRSQEPEPGAGARAGARRPGARTRSQSRARAETCLHFRGCEPNCILWRELANVKRISTRWQVGCEIRRCDQRQLGRDRSQGSR